MTIIDLQVRLMERQTSASPVFKRCLTQIHQSLGRMAQVVQSLKHVRRIVLTEYAAGEKMLDLERSFVMDCVECGSCSFSCPSGIPIVQLIRVAKSSIREQKQKK
jgi:Na+-translocating ferredoxin:NAD+ oxidoreductase RnfC subunit